MASSSKGSKKSKASKQTSTNRRDDDASSTRRDDHVVLLTPFAVFTALLLSALLAFCTGWGCRVFVLEPRLKGAGGALDAPSLSSSSSSSVKQPASSHHHAKGKAGGRDGSLATKTQKKSGMPRKEKKLPPPVLLDGKRMPETKYTGRTLAVVDSVRNSHSLHIVDPKTGATCGVAEERHVSYEEVINAARRAETLGRSTNVTEKTGGYDDGEEHLPAGQHLLIDIKNVDGSFLNSEERLASAMIDVVSESKLTLLSYHCHSLIPAGVSCVGVLLESHISFHTWPEEGVITLDLFTCGNGLLVPVVPVIERLFAVPQVRPEDDAEDGGNATAAAADPPRVVWSHVLRGFRPPLTEGSKWRPLENDMADMVLDRMGMDYKKEVVSVVSDYQQIDVYDVIDPRVGSILQYERSLDASRDTYESRHPELYRPNRMVFMDGVVQSTRLGDAAYHEGLVHPAMFAHSGPKRVAIIGGGEGATLREVLKHRTVEYVKMVEIDEVMVNVSRQYLPEWSSCSDLIGSADNCFDDDRTDLLCEDALAWFMKRFEYPCVCGADGEAKSAIDCCRHNEGAERAEEGEEEDSSDDEDEDEEEDDEEEAVERVEPFDVIIMDALDPQEGVAFAEVLYRNDKFLSSLYAGLSENGLLVMQLGETPHHEDPAEEMTDNKNRAHVVAMLERLGFESLHIYQEAHSGFHYPWSYLVACKSAHCRHYWYQSAPQLEIEMHYRLLRTHSGERPLKHFDSATMQFYQNPTKSWEVVFCRRNPVPPECSTFRGYDNSIVNYPTDNFEVKASSLGEGAGRGTFATTDIPKGSYVAQEDAHKKLHFTARTTYLMENLCDNLPQASDLRDVMQYMYGYGFQFKVVADYEYYVDSGIMTFVNHGCNGTNNIEDLGAPLHAYTSESNVNPHEHVVLNPLNVTSVYNPVRDRHLPQLASAADATSRDIRAGEEMLQNYMLFISDEDDWVDEVTHLKAQCRGEVVGDIVKEEESSRLDDDEDD